MTIDVRMSLPAPTQSTYRVSGSDFQGLREQMAAHGEWGRYEGRLTSSTRGRPVTRLTITCRPVIVLPEWRGRASAPTPKQQEWDRMLDCLRRHEDEHDRILREVAEEYRQRFADFDPAQTSELTRLRREMLSTHNDRQQAYDRRTRHGQTEGVDLRDV